MKNIITGFIAVCATFAWASSAFCLPPLQQQVILSISGHVTENDGTGVQFINVNSGLLSDPKMAIGELDKLVDASGGTASTNASGAAGQGHISVAVGGFATVSGPAGPVQGGAIGSGAGGEAQAYYTDYLHFSNLGPPGTTFLVNGDWNLSGTVTSSAVSNVPATNPPGVYVVNAQGGASLQVSGSGFDNSLFLDPLIASSSTIIDNSGRPVTEQLFAPASIHVTLGGTTGTPVLVQFGFDAKAGGNVSSSDLVNHGGGSAGGNVDFSHTAAWGGITTVTDENGNILTGWTVTSDSGFDYSQPFVDVPEPSIFALLAVALLGLFWASRRYRRNPTVAGPPLN